MPTAYKFFPQKKVIEIKNLEYPQNMVYIIDTNEDLQKEDFKLRFAFPAKLPLETEELKTKVKNILAHIIDAQNFLLQYVNGQWMLEVPMRTSQEKLPVKVNSLFPIMVKLSKVTGQNAGWETQCIQQVRLQLGYAEKPNKKNELTLDNLEENEGLDNNALDKLADGKNEEKDHVINTYSGLISIDYGTTNSTVAVRDPCFASEEVRGQLGQEQWKGLCEWMNIWLEEHIANLEPTDLDIFVQSLCLVAPTAGIPECGSPRDSIHNALLNMSDISRVQILQELVARISGDAASGHENPVMKILAAESIKGFEAVIDANSMESQRYFVLELDRNIGPAPISSVLQIIKAPGCGEKPVEPDIEFDDAPVEENKDNEKQKKAAEDEDVSSYTDTDGIEVDMGARVSLLLHSAALGEIDIRQFILSTKRYFGTEQLIEVIPAEGDGHPVELSPRALSKVTYRELLKRAIADIHRRAEMGQFQDATWAGSVVATFPTTYPASLRKIIREILEELQIEEIDTRFDEATAAAIFYIWKEIGADPVCGMHGLMARSRKDKYGRSYQNILLYDLGGGTTDIALIQLLYEELAIFEEGEDRGNGGSYFRITPRLLGTTGHRNLGGDLLTLWIFRLIKSKLADTLLKILISRNIEPPIDSPLNQLLMNLPEELGDSEVQSDLVHYRDGALLEWTAHPTQFLRQYTTLNEEVIDVLIPTRFIDDRSRVPNFFTLWEITDEVKKSLGTPIIENFGTCLGTGLAKNWPEEVELDSGQVFNFMQMAHPWLTSSGQITQEDFNMVILQNEMNNVITDTIRQSVSLAASLAKSRLVMSSKVDRVDRLILAGLSCNMKVIQDVAQEVFRSSDGIFDYDPANVRFDRNSAKTAVSLGACIGRYMESVRIDPFNEKTRQMLRDGYDQIELVIENLFCYLPCRLAYDSLVAMVPIFEQGQELNIISYWDDRRVARTSIRDLRPVQEKFWIYRIDFPGAEPQYLGLIDAEQVAITNGFDNFRKFREEYVVGFEADAELMIRCFFLPREIIIQAENPVEPREFMPVDGLFVPSTEEIDVASEAKKAKLAIKTASEKQKKTMESEDDFDNENQDPTDEENNEQNMQEEVSVDISDSRLEMGRTILVQEYLDDMPLIEQGEQVTFNISYGGGSIRKCIVSPSLSIRDEYIFKIAQPKSQYQDDDTEDSNNATENIDEPLFAHFVVDENEIKEATFICDEDQRCIMLTNCLFDIQIWEDIQFSPPKADINCDPFCGCH